MREWTNRCVVVYFARMLVIACFSAAGGWRLLRVTYSTDPLTCLCLVATSPPSSVSSFLCVWLLFALLYSHRCYIRGGWWHRAWGTVRGVLLVMKTGPAKNKHPHPSPRSRDWGNNTWCRLQSLEGVLGTLKILECTAAACRLHSSNRFLVGQEVRFAEATSAVYGLRGRDDVSFVSPGWSLRVTATLPTAHANKHFPVVQS